MGSMEPIEKKLSRKLKIQVPEELDLNQISTSGYDNVNVNLAPEPIDQAIPGTPHTPPQKH